jgi:hypothetical protein
MAKLKMPADAAKAALTAAGCEVIRAEKRSGTTTAGREELRTVLPEVKAKLVVQGLYPVGICGADFGAFFRKQYDDYGRAIREANIKVE